MDALGLIFAYDGDNRMGDLSRPRTTASIPFGGRYRVIDFMLSNLSNAGVRDVGVIMKEGYQSLLDHIGSGKDWDLARKLGGVSLLPPFGYSRSDDAPPRRFDAPYKGKLDGLLGVADYISGSDHEYVILSDGHCIVNLDLSQVFAAHKESGADITVVCSKELVGEANRSVYFTFGEDGRATGIATYPDVAGENESLGVYVMKKSLLEYMMKYGRIRDYSYFERGVLRELIPELNIRPYFHTTYFAKIQSTMDYYKHSMELMERDVRQALFNASNPIYTRIRDDAPTYYSDNSQVIGSLVADGCIIEGRVENSILFRGVRVKAGATVKNSIVMENGVICENAFLNYVIADKQVTAKRNAILIGSPNYPSVIQKNSVI